MILNTVNDLKERIDLEWDIFLEDITDEKIDPVFIEGLRKSAFFKKMYGRAVRKGIKLCIDAIKAVGDSYE